MVHDTLGNAEFVHQSHFYLKLTGFIALWVLSGTLITYKTFVQQSCVVFQRVHDAQGLKKKWAEWRPYIIAAMVGGVVKELFDIIKKVIER
jgi:hypothetical protein